MAVTGQVIANLLRAVSDLMPGVGKLALSADQFRNLNESEIAARGLLTAMDAEQGAEINRLVVLCTSHLTPSTREHIQHPGDSPVIYPNDYGAFIYVPTDAGEVDETATEPSLLACIVYARSLSCNWIKFDSDGPVMTDLATYPDGEAIDDDPDRCAESPDGRHSYANTSIADIGEDTGEGMYRCTWCGEGET